MTHVLPPTRLENVLAPACRGLRHVGCTATNPENPTTRDILILGLVCDCECHKRPNRSRWSHA